jgi:hypothetical protein
MGIIAIPEGGNGERILDLATTGVPAGAPATLFLDFDRPITGPLVVELTSTWPGFPLPTHVHVAPLPAGSGNTCVKRHANEPCPARRVLLPVEVGGLRTGTRSQTVAVIASLAASRELAVDSDNRPQRDPSLPDWPPTMTKSDRLPGKETRKIEFLAQSRCPAGQVRLAPDQCGAPAKTPNPAPGGSVGPGAQPSLANLAPGTLPQPLMPGRIASPSGATADSQREALAFCWQNKAQQWYCDGRSQETAQVGEKDMMVQLANVGCKSPHLLSGTMTILTSTRTPSWGQQIGWLFACGVKLDKGESGHQTGNRDIRRFWSGIPW